MVSWRRSAAVVRHDLRVLRADPVFLIVFTLMPLVVMAFVKPGFRGALVANGVSDATGAEQAVPGMAVLFALFLVGNVGFGVFREHGWNTWERLRASFASPAEIMAGKVVVPVLTAGLQLTVLFGVGGLLYGLRVEGSVPALVLVAAAFALCLVCLGLVLLAVCRSVMQLNAIANLGAMVLGGIGGALTPITALPGWAQAVAPAVPSYWAMRGFRSVIIEPGGLADVVLPVAVLLSTAVALAAVAVWRFRFEETKVGFA